MFKDNFQQWEERDLKAKVEKAKTKEERAEVRIKPLLQRSCCLSGGCQGTGSRTDISNHKTDVNRRWRWKCPSV